MANETYPADYGQYLNECFNAETGTVTKSYDEWKSGDHDTITLKDAAQHK